METAIASDVTNTVDASRDFELLVTVRDRTGGPLAGASVNVEMDGGAAWSDKTDATGLARFSGRAPGTLVAVTAFYRPESGADFDVVYRGEATLVLDPDRCDGQRSVTVLVSIAHPLKHLFPWQNREVRKLVHWYMTDPDDSSSFDDSFANRLRHLRFVIEAYSDIPSERELFETRVKNWDAMDGLTFQIEQAPTQKKRDDLAAKNQLQFIFDQVGAASEGASHRQVMKTLLERTFQWSRQDPTKPDSPVETIPDWLKYGIVQLTGLRYRGAGNSYYPIDALVYNLREKEIDEVEHGPKGVDPSPKRQREYAREYADYLDSRRDLVDDVQKRFLSQLDCIHDFDGHVWAKQRTTGSLKEAPVRGPSAKTTSSKKLLVSEVLEQIAMGAGALTKDEALHLRAAACALTEVWIRDAVVRSTDAAPANEDELHGAIVDRFQNRHLPEVVWRRAVMCTRLFNDFADGAWDSHPAGWNRPEVPVEWRRVFRDRTYESWSQEHKETLQPVPTGAVCNQITEMLGRARGITLQTGILGHMSTIHTFGAPGIDARTGSARKLFRPKAASAIQQGDLVIWVRMYADKPAWTVKANLYDIDLLTEEGQVPRSTSLGDLQANATTGGWSWGRTEDHKVVRCKKYSAQEIAKAAENGNTLPSLVTQVVSVMHVAMVARVLDNQVLTFETAHPAGMRVRPKLVNQWNVFIGRMPEGKSPRLLAYYLNPKNVIDRTDDD